MSVDVTVIVCTRNRKESLAAALESLQRLVMTDSLTYEILTMKAIQSREVLERNKCTHGKQYMFTIKAKWAL